ncbi:MAG TPA: hypothetical protein VFJ17_08800 [Mycobacteriales bacterium]|nr:hypothetical protein [Mycobacteriales bacterium]
MVQTQDEPALRAALTDLTVGQPDLPVDRVAGVRRKHAHRRQLQAAAGACAVAVIAVGAVALGGTFNGQRSAQSLNRPVPSWALRWDDHRDGSVPQAMLTAAVKHWVSDQRAKTPLPSSQPVSMPPVVWYLGERIPGTDQVVAVFEATGLHAGALPLTKGPRLVVAHGSWNDVMREGAKGGYAWSYVDVAAPPPGYTGVVGGYAPVGDGNGGFDNIIWLLTSPKARGASWTVQTAGDRTVSGDLPLDKGYGSVQVGPVASRVRITALATGPEGQSVPFDGFVGVPGAPGRQAPTLVYPDALVGVPATGTVFGESASQGSSTFFDESTHARPGRATTIYARCYSAGGSPFIRVVVDRDSAQHGVRIPCDDRQHVVPGNPTGPAIALGDGPQPSRGHEYVIQAGALTAWRVAIVVH